MSLNSFTGAYMECAVWSSFDDHGEPLDNSGADLSEAVMAQMREDCADFYAPNCNSWDGKLGDEQAGHDFWLTRNRHGAGFWDRGLGKLGDDLTELAHAYGSFDLYIGDDGLIYGG